MNDRPFILIESDDLLTTKEPYGLIMYKGLPIAMKEGNIIILRSDSKEFLDYVIEFLKVFKNRLEPVVDDVKPTRISFRLYTPSGKVYYLGFGRLSFFEYKYVINKCKELGIIEVNKEKRELEEISLKIFDIYNNAAKKLNILI
jgi:hypothetical protein